MSWEFRESLWTFEKLKRWNQETKTLWNQETKKARNEETNKNRRLENYFLLFQKWDDFYVESTRTLTSTGTHETKRTFLNLERKEHVT